MNDEEKDQLTIESTDPMLLALKAQAELSKTDPQVREEFIRHAADWVISLVEEIEQYRTMVHSLRNQVSDYKQAIEIYKQTGRDTLSQLEKVREEIQRGGDPNELYERYLRNLIEGEDGNDDLVN